MPDSVVSRLLREGAGPGLPNSVVGRLLREGASPDPTLRTPTVQLAPADVAVQRATREELLTAYNASVTAGNWADVAVRLNGFNDPDITRLVGALNQATLLLVKDAALTAMPGWNARVVGPANARLSALMGGGKVLHAGAKEIQDYLLHSPFLKSYVASRFSGGGNPLEGHVHNDDAATFRTAFIAYGTSLGMTQSAAEAKEPDVNAFRDGNDVHVHESRGEFTTTIHESMHFFSADAYRGQLGFNANEGTTEFFTQIVCFDQGLTRAGYYASELNSIRTLVASAGLTTVADAYYGGNMAALRTAVDTAKGAGTFGRWTVLIKAGSYSQANTLLA